MFKMKYKWKYFSFCSALRGIKPFWFHKHIINETVTFRGQARHHNGLCARWGEKLLLCSSFYSRLMGHQVADASPKIDPCGINLPGEPS